MVNYEVWIIEKLVCYHLWHGTIPSNLEVGIDYARGVLKAFHTARREFPQRMTIGVEEGIKTWFSMNIDRFRLDVDDVYNINTKFFLGWSSSS